MSNHGCGLQFPHHQNVSTADHGFSVKSSSVNPLTSNNPGKALLGLIIYYQGMSVSGCCPTRPNFCLLYVSHWEVITNRANLCLPYMVVCYMSYLRHLIHNDWRVTICVFGLSSHLNKSLIQTMKTKRQIGNMYFKLSLMAWFESLYSLKQSFFHFTI